MVNSANRNIHSINNPTSDVVTVLCFHFRQYTHPTMNFSPFGGHFSTAIPAIHQFAAKFTHDNPTAGNTLCSSQDNSNRYTANGIPSFTQHHPPQQQMLNPTKYQGSYMNQAGVAAYGHQVCLKVFFLLFWRG